MGKVIGCIAHNGKARAFDKLPFARRVNPTGQIGSLAKFPIDLQQTEPGILQKAGALLESAGLESFIAR